MATNFEIIFNRTNPVTLADGTKHLFTHDEILTVCKEHNCDWILSPHPIDELSSFEHYHCGIHTTSDNTYGTIASWFNLPVNAVNKVKGQFKSTYALYLAHLDKGSVERGKTPIDTNLIERNFILDYDALQNRIKSADAEHDLLLQIANGTIKRYQFDTVLSDDFRIRNARSINTALEIWNTRKMKGEREMNKLVVWIYGDAGLGKTELAKYFAKERNMDFYMSDSGSNPFDNYSDEPCIILDDVGADNLNGKVILKLFDPYNKCFTKARYFNKAIDSDMIVVTSSQSPETFWTACRDDYSVNGSWEQLTRRLTGGCYHLVSTRQMDVRMYDATGKNPVTYSLSVPDDVQAKTITVTASDRLNNAFAMLGLTLDDDGKKMTVSGEIKRSEAFENDFKQLGVDDLPEMFKR